MDSYVRSQLVQHREYLGRHITDLENLEEAQSKHLDRLREQIAETKANAVSVEAALAEA